MRSTSEAVVAAGISLLALTIYAITLAPSVPGGDSGELIAAAYTGGVPHPPGYPLYTLLAWGMSGIPFGEVAFRVNALSALLDALAAGVLCCAVARWSRSVGAGLLAAGLFAFAPLIWSYAVVAEVFALNNLLVCCLLYCLVRFADSPSLRWASWGALTVGLGLSNHHTFVVYAIPVVLYVAWRGRGFLWTPRALAQVLALFVLGVLPYLYLPIAGAARNAVTWGDFSSLETILHHVLRRDYGTFQLGAGETGQWGAWGRWLLVIQALFRNTLYVGLPVAFLGCVYGAMGARKDRDVVAVMLVGWLAYLAMIGFLFNLAIETPVLVGVEARFWQMAAIPVFAWTGLGVQRLVSRLVPGNSVETVVVTIAVVAIGLQCAMHFQAASQRDNFVFRDYANTILAGLPPGALLILNSDPAINSVRYLQVVEGVRKDVRVAPLTWLELGWYTDWMREEWPTLEFPGQRLSRGRIASGAIAGSGYPLKDFLAANLGSEEIFIYPGFGSAQGALIRPDYRTVPMGLAKQVLSAEVAQGLDLKKRRSQALEALAGFDPDRTDRYGAESWEFFAGQSYRRAKARVERMGSRDSAVGDYPERPR